MNMNKYLDIKPEVAEALVDVIPPFLTPCGGSPARVPSFT